MQFQPAARYFGFNLVHRMFPPEDSFETFQNSQSFSRSCCAKIIRLTFKNNSTFWRLKQNPKPTYFFWQLTETQSHPPTTIHILSFPIVQAFPNIAHLTKSPHLAQPTRSDLQMANELSFDPRDQCLTRRKPSNGASATVSTWPDLLQASGERSKCCHPKVKSKFSGHRRVGLHKESCEPDVKWPASSLDRFCS